MPQDSVSCSSVMPCHTLCAAIRVAISSPYFATRRCLRRIALNFLKAMAAPKTKTISRVIDAKLLSSECVFVEGPLCEAGEVEGLRLPRGSFKGNWTRSCDVVGITSAGED